MARKEILDRFVSKVVSRKLLVWGTATAALFVGKVDPESWIQVCMVYLGSQAALDFALNYVKAKNGKSNLEGVDG